MFSSIKFSRMPQIFVGNGSLKNTWVLKYFILRNSSSKDFVGRALD